MYRIARSSLCEGLNRVYKLFLYFIAILLTLYCIMFTDPINSWVFHSVAQNRLSATSFRLDSISYNRTANLRTLLLNEKDYKPIECDCCDIMTSCRHTRVRLLNYDARTRIVHVRIHTYTQTNEPKSRGGDIIVIRAMRLLTNDVTAGHVTDHRNGSYTGSVHIPWTGKTRVMAKLVSSYENTCLRYNALVRYGNNVYAMQKGWGIHGVYKHEGIEERTPCGANPFIYQFSSLCNFTSMNGGVPWFCGHPKHEKLRCKHIYSFSAGAFDTSSIDSNRKIKFFGHGVFRQTVLVQIPRWTMFTLHKLCTSHIARDSWDGLASSGYWANNRWNLPNCQSRFGRGRPANKKASLFCLQNKTLIFLGDSTVRQYYEWFGEALYGFGKFKFPRDALGPQRTYHGNTTFTHSNITIGYYKHEMPFHNYDFPPKDIVSLPEIIHGLSQSHISGEALILLVTYHTHLQAFLPSQLRIRYRLLIKAIKQLLKAKPGAKVFIKGPHLTIYDERWFDPNVSLMQKQILMEEFYELRDKVNYLDVWNISVAFNNEGLHPAGNTMASQIQQMMAYIC